MCPFCAEIVLNFFLVFGWYRLRNLCYPFNSNVLYQTFTESFALDLDECTDGTDNCDQDAFCENTDGDFTCTCNNQFTGDGVTCDGIHVNF